MIKDMCRLHIYKICTKKELDSLIILIILLLARIISKQRGRRKKDHRIICSPKLETKSDDEVMITKTHSNRFGRSPMHTRYG